MRGLMEWNQSLSMLPSLAKELPFSLMQPVLDPVSHSSHLASEQSFHTFIEQIHAKGILPSDSQSFTHLMHFMGEIQAQSKSLEDQLTFLNSTKPKNATYHQQQITDASNTLLKLKDIQKTFDKACYKPEGKGLLSFAKRLFGNETWEQWATARTDLGQLVVLASDYLQGGVSDIQCSRRLSDIDLTQASKTAGNLLNTLEEHGVEEEHIFPSHLDARWLAESTNVSTFLTALGGTGADYGGEFQASKDGNWLIIGTTESFGAGGSDMLLVKLDIRGAMVWSIALGGVDDDQGTGLKVSVDGGCLITGVTSSFGAVNDDIIVSKLDAEGELKWARILGGSGTEVGVSPQINANGSLLLTGITSSFGAGGNDVFIAQLNIDGEVEQAHVLGGSSADVGSSLQVTNDGGSLITGWTESFGAGGYDVLLTKLDLTGILEWSLAMGGLNDEYCYELQPTIDGGWVLVADTYSFGVGGSDVLVAKLNSDGKLIWGQCLGGSSNDFGYAIEASLDGGAVLTGFTGSFGAGGGDVLVAKLNAGGALEWASALGGTHYDYGMELQASEDGGWVLTGYTISIGAGGNDLLVVKLNANGTIEGCSSVLDITHDISVTNITALLSIEDITEDTAVTNITDLISVADVDLTQTNITSMNEEMVCYAEHSDTMISKATTQALTTMSSEQNAWHNTETFLKSFGASSKDYGRAIDVMDNGDIAFSGFTSSFGAGVEDILLGRLGEGLQLQWAYALGSEGSERSTSVTATLDDGLITIGYSNELGAGLSDGLVVKVNSSGSIEWAYTIGGTSYDDLYSVASTKDGGFAILGRSYSFGVEGSCDFLAVKLNAQGDLQWAWTFGGSEYDEGRSIHELASGDLVVAGFTAGFDADSNDVLIAKLSDQGILQWTQILGGISAEYGFGIKETTDGALVVVGYSESFNIGLEDAFVVKVDANGSLLWAFAIGGESYDRFYRIQETDDGCIIVMGYTKSYGFGGVDVFISKLNADGKFLWSRTIGGTSNEDAYGIKQTDDGGFVLAGGSYNFGYGNLDVLIARLNADGWIENCSNIQSVSPTIVNITDILKVSTVSADAFNAANIIHILNASLNVTDVTDSLLEEQVCGASELEKTTASAVQTTAQPVTSTPRPGTPGNELRSPIVNLKDGGYAVMGIDTNVTDGIPRFELLRMNSTGHTDWIWQWPLDSTGYDKMVSSVETSDGGMVLLGRTGRYGAGDYDILIVKLNATGDVEWSNTLGGNHSDISHSIQETVAGDLVITGRTQSPSGMHWDVLAAKLNTTGDLQWVYGIGGNKTDVGHSIQVTSEDDVLITGYSQSFGQGGSDMLLLHLHATGELNRSWVIGSSKHERGYTVEGLVDGGIAIGGYTNSFGSGGYDALVAKLYADGDLDWYGALGGMGDDMAFTITEDDEGVLSLDGLSDANSNSRDRMQAVLEADGTITYCSAAFIDTPAALNTSASFVVEAMEPIQHDLSNMMQVQSASINASQVGSSFLESIVNFRTCVVEAALNASRRVLGALNKGSSTLETAFKTRSGVARSHEFIEPMQVRSESQRSDRDVDQAVLAPKL